MPRTSVPRESGINAFRIFNLALVVFAHSTALAPPFRHDDPHYLMLIIAQCSVPMFFITSGYLLRWEEGDALAVTRWSLRKLLPLYCFWLVLYVAGAWLLGAGSLLDLLATLPGGPTRHLWFLPALGIGLSAVSLSLRTLGVRLSWLIAIVLAAAGLWFGSYEEWAGLPAHSLRSGMLSAPLFVLIGVYLAKGTVPRQAALFAVVAVLGYVFQVFDDKWLSAAPGYAPQRQVMVTLATFPYAVGMFLFARSLGGRIVERLARLRPYFATIYCIHPMIIAGFAFTIHQRSFGLAVGVALMSLALSLLAAVCLPVVGRLSRDCLQRLHSERHAAAIGT